MNYVEAVFHPHKNLKIRGRLFKLLSFYTYFMKQIFKMRTKGALMETQLKCDCKTVSPSASNHLGFNHKHTSCLSRIVALKPCDFGNKRSSSVQTVTYVPTVVFLQQLTSRQTSDLTGLNKGDLTTPSLWGPFWDAVAHRHFPSQAQHNTFRRHKLPGHSCP